MKIILTSIDEPLAGAWEKYCGDLDIVTVFHGSIFDTKPQAVVSPANSFGFMDGGIDYTYSLRFGWGLEQRLQRLIREEYDGELLVGQAAILATDDKTIPYLVSAPTMRIPTILPKATVNPYLAARAALLCAMKNDLESIAFPGLGTGIGEVSPA
jgi:O-acetyl-ADP-ribose deacetylase (regulator of RNase III)